jgi:membrane protease YdiL (CAAX protease family)
VTTTIACVLGAYAISWLLWWPLASIGGAAPDSPLRYLHLLGGLGPAVAAFLSVAAFDGRPGVRRLLDRARRWRVGWRWHAVAWLSPLALLAIAVLAIRLATGDGQPVRFDRSTEFPRLPVLAYWAVSVLAYGFGEEIGWRGVLLPRLQGRFNALTSTVIVSVVWAGWHLPLFWFAPGMGRMGGGEIVGWYASLLTGSVLFTWLFNATGGSVLIPAIFHGAMDVAFLASGPDLLPMVLGAFITILGVAVLVTYGPSSLAPRPRVADS